MLTNITAFLQLVHNGTARGLALSTAPAAAGPPVCAGRLCPLSPRSPHCHAATSTKLPKVCNAHHRALSAPRGAARFVLGLNLTFSVPEVNCARGKVPDLQLLLPQLPRPHQACASSSQQAATAGGKEAHVAASFCHESCAQRGASQAAGKCCVKTVLTVGT